MSFQISRARVLAIAAFSIAGVTAEANECKQIVTQLNGSTFPCAESPVGLCADGEITSGLLKGIKSLVYTSAAFSAGLATEPPTVLSYSADAIFSTDQGDLYLTQVAVSDTSRRVFTEINRIVGGTGRFEGASGNLFISGTVDSSDLVTDFESEITGAVCLSESV